MKQTTFLLFSLFLTAFLHGQNQRTEELFFNLPLNANKEEILKLLKKDTVHFSYERNNGKYSDNHVFHLNRIDSFFNTFPEKVAIVIGDLKVGNDTNDISLSLHVNFSKNKFSEKQLITLKDKIIKTVISEYEKKREYSQSYPLVDKTKKTKKTFTQQTIGTEFFKKTYDTNLKLNIAALINSGKRDYKIVAIYRLDK